MSFDQFVLSIGSNGPISTSLNKRLHEQAYELTSFSIQQLISLEDDFNDIAEKICESVIAQDIIYLIIEGNFLSEPSYSYLNQILRSLIKCSQQNRVKKIILCTSAMSHIFQDYSFIAKAYYMLKDSRIPFEMKHEPKELKFLLAKHELIQNYRRAINLNNGLLALFIWI